MSPPTICVSDVESDEETLRNKADAYAKKKFDEGRAEIKEVLNSSKPTATTKKKDEDSTTTEVMKALQTFKTSVDRNFSHVLKDIEFVRTMLQQHVVQRKRTQPRPFERDDTLYKPHTVFKEEEEKEMDEEEDEEEAEDFGTPKSK